jgi:hypothetical protein
MIGIILAITGNSYEEITNSLLFVTRQYLGVNALSNASYVNILYRNGSLKNV